MGRCLRVGPECFLTVDSIELVRWCWFVDVWLMTHLYLDANTIYKTDRLSHGSSILLTSSYHEVAYQCPCARPTIIRMFRSFYRSAWKSSSTFFRSCLSCALASSRLLTVTVWLSLSSDIFLSACSNSSLRMEFSYSSRCFSLSASSSFDSY